MNKLFKNMLASALGFSMLALCSGCGTETVKAAPFNANFEIRTVEDTAVAENSAFRLDWDTEYKRILLTDKGNGCVWSTTPSSALTVRTDAEGNPKTVHPQINSPIVIEYMDSDSQELVSIAAYASSVKSNAVSEEKIENGLRATYFFPDAEISVPVEYTLRENGVNIALDIGGITENEYKLCRISIAPFMCSIENSEENGYLFVPSGSGALIYKKSETDIPLTYSQEVYGTDSARHLEYEEKATTEKEIRLPVYGAKFGNKALCAIIEDGAESAAVEVSAAAANIGYSGVYSAFSVRGYQWVKIKNKYQRLYSESPAKGRASVTFIPLYGERAGYMGMAEVYRSYLKDKYGMSECENENMLSLEMVGGVNIKTSFLGIPRNDFLPVTTVKNAEKITEELYELTGQPFSVKLTGYGKSGIDIGKAGGGFSLNSELGSTSELKALSEYCKTNGIGLFMDFDLVRFNKSGSGIGTLSGKAVTVNGQTADCYEYGLWSGTRNYNTDKYFLVSRSKLPKLTERLEKAADKYSLYGVSLDTLSSSCYSDYSSADSFVKGNMAADVGKILMQLKKRKTAAACSDANDYAAVYASQLYDTPLQSSEFKLFDESVPFYQAVFKGYVPMSSPSLNTTPNECLTLLRAVEGGCGICYTLSGKYDIRLLTAASPDFYGSTYSDVKPIIEKTVSENKEYFECVKGAKITGHSILENGIRKTTFDNGCTVYVNYGDSQQSAENSVIDAMSYKLLKGE